MIGSAFAAFSFAGEGETLATGEVDGLALLLDCLVGWATQPAKNTQAMIESRQITDLFMLVTANLLVVIRIKYEFLG